MIIMGNQVVYVSLVYENTFCDHLSPYKETHKRSTKILKGLLFSVTIMY